MYNKNFINHILRGFYMIRKLVSRMIMYKKPIYSTKTDNCNINLIKIVISGSEIR